MLRAKPAKPSRYRLPQAEEGENLEGAKLTLAVADSTFVDTSTANELDLLIINRALVKPTFTFPLAFNSSTNTLSITNYGNLGLPPYYAIFRPTKYGSIAEALKAAPSGHICTRSKASVPGKPPVPSDTQGIFGCDIATKKTGFHSAVVALLPNTEYEIGYTNGAGVPLGTEIRTTPP